MDPPPIERTSLKQFAAAYERVLGDLETHGVRWRGTRFDAYKRRILAAADLTYPGPVPFAGDAVGQAEFFEGASQAQQLMDASNLLAVDAPEVAARLRLVMAGQVLPPADDEADDRPRNTLVELTTAALLHRRRFSVRLPSAAEDVFLEIDDLLPFRVECKRPAHSGTLEKNLKRLRHQLRGRCADGKSRGMAVVAVDRMLGFVGGVGISPDGPGLLRYLTESMRDVIVTIQQLDVENRVRLAPTTPLAALLLVGAVFLSDPGYLVTVSQMGLSTTLPDSHKASRRIREALGPMLVAP